jgi:cell pole-organizing protein PopZ
MTQPAKVQEPSMEEILASIRRIIADDEAKPATADRPSAPPAPAKLEKSVSPSAAKAPSSDPVPPAPAPPKAVVAPSPPPPAPRAAPAPPPAPAETNSQDDIDALLNGLDEATTPEEIRPASSDGDVLELTDEMALPDPPRPAFKRVEPTDDLEFTEQGGAVPRPPLFETPPVESPVASQQILSRSTVSAVESAFNSLAHTVLSQNARTLEDLVKEMLRPMLKSWLDDNLPGLVERIVKAEIERVSRGR